MLSQLPARDEDRLATESLVLAVESRVRTDMTVGFAEVDQRFTRLEASVDQRFTRLEAKVDIGFEALRGEMAAGLAAVAEQVHAEMRRWFVWSYGAMFVLLVAVVTAAKILE